MTRFVDDVKKQRGLTDNRPTGLRLDVEAATPVAKPAEPPPLGGFRITK